MREQDNPRPGATDEPAFSTIGIVGLGLIGGSVALAVRERWPSATIIGVDRPEVVARATTRRAIDAGGDQLEALSTADLVVLAAPVRQNLQLLAALASVVDTDAVVTDTGSTKRDIVDAAAAFERLVFVGGHPLGGAATGGFGAARPDLFRLRAWVFTPTSQTPASALDRLTRFAAGLGAEPCSMTAGEHDRVLAFLSHLPQLTASALMSVVGDAVGPDGLALAGGGLADTTRLASSPADIWRDITSSNADQIGPALDALIAELSALRARLRDDTAVDEVFERAARWRARLTSHATL